VKAYPAFIIYTHMHASIHKHTHTHIKYDTPPKLLRRKRPTWHAVINSTV